MSWEELKASWLPNYDVYTSPGMTDVVGHQFTGDRCHLPGVYDNGLGMNAILYKNRTALDISVFKADFLSSISGQIIPPSIPLSTYTLFKVVPAAINVRSAPVSTTATWVRYAYSGEIVQVIGNLTNGYVQLADKTWIWQTYLQKI